MLLPLGGLLVLIALFSYFAANSPSPRKTSGDVVYRGEHTTFYFPSSPAFCSRGLSLLFWLLDSYASD